MTNRQQAERKAMELYPQDYGYECIDGVVDEIDVNEPQRAAFMQCFDLMPTGSLPMTREDEVKKRIIEALTERRDRLRYSVARYPADTEELEEKDRMWVEIFTDVIKELKETWPATPPAPESVGMTRENAAQEYAKKYGTLGHRETARKGFIAGTHFTAPVSSAAKPATGYSEAQVRDAIRLAREGYQAHESRWMESKQPDEIISSLNQKP